MDNCIFCKIAAGEIPCAKVYEDDRILGFKDINPVAPVHVVFIPKKHVMDSADDLNDDNKAIVADILVAISKTAKQLGLSNGYRIINNCGEDAGQTVKHIHFHLIGGEKLPQ